MITTHNPETYQLQLLDDAATDAARRDRQEWQRAIDANLHAVADYVHDDCLIIWQPGKRAFDVQVASQSRCTCQRHRLIGRCPHTALAARLEAIGHTVSTDSPIAAMEVSNE